MDLILNFIQSHILWAPYIIFFLLLLAGFNIPVSEDLMLFVSATLAVQNPELLSQLFISVFLGAYLSDLICYQLGRHMGPKLWNFRLFANMISRDKVSRISHFYEQYGVVTLLLGRFIPFGVRNGLFLTAGLGKMEFKRFAFCDLIACTVSTVSYFSLYYIYGEMIIDYIKRTQKAIFILGLIIVLVWLWKRRSLKRQG